MPTADLIFLFGENLPHCTHRVDKHFENYCTLQYMNAGDVELSVGPQTLTMSGRWFWSAYSGPRVRFAAARPGGAWHHRYLAFKGPLVWRWEKDGLFPVRPTPAPGDVDFGDAFDDLLTLSRQTDRRGQRRAVHKLEGLLLDLADAPPAGPPATPWLDAALAEIAAWGRSPDTVPASGPDYAALADRLGTSVSTLRRRFAEAVGTSPHDYLLQCRVAAARELLGGSDLPLKAIARQLGYQDVYYFSRQFRRIAGVPPALYRRTRQG